MKKLILLFLVLISGSFSFGQANVYHPFPDTNAIWNTENYYGANTWIYRYTLYGDTLIGSYTYHKVYKITNDSVANPAHMSYYTAIREDTLRRIYVKNLPTCSSTDEILLYDFSLQVGDSVHSNSQCGYLSSLYHGVVIGTDSVLLEDQTYRKRISVSSGFGPEYWIEGIGSVGGLFCPVSDYIVGAWSSLICFKQNDTALYVNSPDCQKCFCSLGTNISASNIEYRICISPNPATISITFSIPPLQVNAEVCVFNSLGEQVLKLKVHKAESEVSIDVAKLPPGMYFVKMNNYSGKFVKQN